MGLRFGRALATGKQGYYTELHYNVEGEGKGNLLNLTYESFEYNKYSTVFSACRTEWQNLQSIAGSVIFRL